MGVQSLNTVILGHKSGLGPLTPVTCAFILSSQANKAQGAKSKAIVSGQEKAKLLR